MKKRERIPSCRINFPPLIAPVGVFTNRNYGIVVGENTNNGDKRSKGNEKEGKNAFTSYKLCGIPPLLLPARRQAGFRYRCSGNVSSVGDRCFTYQGKSLVVIPVF